MLAKGLRKGDCIEVLGVVEPSDRPPRGKDVAESVQAQGADCIRVVSRWADTHGRLSYATAHDGGYKASQRSRSKQGRKAPRLDLFVKVPLFSQAASCGRQVRHLGLHTSWGGGQFRHPEFPKSLGNPENP